MAREEGRGLMKPLLLEHLGLWLTEKQLGKGLGPGCVLSMSRARLARPQCSGQTVTYEEVLQEAAPQAFWQVVMNEIHEPQATTWVVAAAWPSCQQCINDGIYNRTEVRQCHSERMQELPMDMLNVVFTIGLQQLPRQVGQQQLLALLPKVHIGH